MDTGLRQTGRTTRLIAVAKANQSPFVVPYESMVRYCKKLDPEVYVIATTNPEDNRLRGCTDLVFDHTMDEFFPKETAAMRRVYNYLPSEE